MFHRPRQRAQVSRGQHPGAVLLAARRLREQLGAGAEDGLDAIDRFGDGKERVDLVITDVVMPRLGGVATVERLRETLGSFVVIFMSGYLGEAREVLPELGEDVLFLQKPFRLDELHARIRVAMGHEGEGAG